MEKNTQEIKTKLIVKLFQLRRDINCVNSDYRFHKTVKRARNLEKVYRAIDKRSKNSLLIGKDDLVQFDMQNLKKMDLAELKEYN